MTTVVEATEWESRAALHEHLDTLGADTLVLGRDAEAPRRFYTLSFNGRSQSTTVAVWSSGLGPKPSLVVFGNHHGVVGHDMQLTWIDFGLPMEVMSLRLGGAFFTFIPVDQQREIVALHELGVVRVSVDGVVRWSLDTEIIDRWEWKAQSQLILTEMDCSEKISVDVESGRMSRL